MRSSSFSKPADVAVGNHLTLWAAFVIFLTLEQLAATLMVPRTISLTLITDGIDFVLMLSALLIFFENGVVRIGRARLFWMLLAACWGIRLVGQSLWLYFEVVLRKEVPNPFVGDILLFLSNIPVLAALMLQPHVDPDMEGRKSQSTVGFLLLLLWWLYLYLFFVTPWQYIVSDEARYGVNYDRLNGVLDVVLVLTLGFFWRQSFGRRRWFYASFFGAQLLITVSGYLANHAIDEHLYYPGSWYDLPYAMSLASFTAVGLLGFAGARTNAVAERRLIPLHVNALGVLAVLSLPIIGMCTILNRSLPPQINRFRELSTLGTMLAMAFLVFARQHRLGTELTKVNRALREACLTDPLTGVRNRRFFDATISGDTSQVLRSYAAHQDLRTSSDLIFYMVDLDGFKEVNDLYGHNVGDQVLLEVAARINSVIRNSDTLVRWGGDEFLIVSRNSNRREAATFASRILTAVGTPIVGVAFAGAGIRQTCSIGWAAFPWYLAEPGEVPLESVLALADRGVYEAKEAGKNRAIGVSPCDAGTVLLVATAGDRVSSYSVQTLCVIGPLHTPKSRPGVLRSRTVLPRTIVCCEQRTPEQRLNHADAIRTESKDSDGAQMKNNDREVRSDPFVRVGLS